MEIVGGIAILGSLAAVMGIFITYVRMDNWILEEKQKQKSSRKWTWD